MEGGFSINGVQQSPAVTGISVKPNGEISFDGPQYPLPESTGQPQPLSRTPARQRAASRPAIAPQPAA